jgi:hypothetical protein
MPAPIGPSRHIPYHPFSSHLEFELADFLYRKQEMPETGVDTLMDLWAADAMKQGRSPPFANSKDLLGYVADSAS